MNPSFFSFIFVFLLGIVVGICVFGFAIWYVLSFFLLNPDQNEKDKLQQPQQQPPSSTFQLPPVLLSKINDESFKAKENCWAFNFILYFLFRELRNSEAIRRWLLRKLAMEFDEILATSMLGRVFSNITIQSIDMGQNFPVINWLKTTKVELHPVSNCISTLDILVDLTYSGGFTFAIEAQTHLKHSAYLSVKVNEVKGKARIQFTTDPYAHWSISFSENPEIDIGVTSQLYGKSFSQVTSIIAAQLKRSVRKKHTLPMFKIRYKPFFVRMEHAISALLPQTSPQVETTGKLVLTIVECRGLMKTLIHDTVYATVGVGDYDWVAVYPSAAESKIAYAVRDVICVKTVRREANLDFVLTQNGNIPVVESLNPLLSSASISHAVLSTVSGKSYSCPEVGLEVGDEIVAVDGKKVTSVKQCIKCFRGSKSVKVVWRVRRQVTISSATESEASTSANRGNGATPAETPEDDRSLDRSHSVAGSEFDDKCETGIHTIGSPYVLFESTSNGNYLHSVGRTRVLRSSNDPIFQETFNYDVAETNRFLNATLWSSTQETEDKSSDSTPSGSPAKKNRNRSYSDKLFPFGQDKVIGCLSIPLMDVLSECSTTGMGFFVKDYYLASPDGNAVDGKEHNLKDHSGFDPRLCYGRITLSFLYTPTDDASKRKLSIITSSILNSKPEIEVARAASGSPTDENQPHQFIRTHFRSAAICDYCNKKIWLKEAYTCQNCNMKCHKKCYERCLVNTTCRGELYRPKANTSCGTVTPEIIMTQSEPSSKNAAGKVDADNNEHNETVNHEKMNIPPVSTVRRRTLGGLIVAVQNKSSQLRRVGSATALVPPVLNPNSASKSLPPSPQASPTFQRKPESETDDNSAARNPFEILDSGSPTNIDADLRTAVEHIMNNPNEEFVSMAKETGRDVFKGMSLSERKLRLNDLLNRLQGEIDTASNERMALEKEEPKAPPGGKSALLDKICACEERVKALAILMLHYCAGLQQIHEEEELEKHNQIMTTSVLEDDEDDEPDDNDDEHSVSAGLLSNLSASTTCLIELGED